MQFTSTQKASAAWLAIGLGLGLLLWLLAPVLSPFLVAAVFAYVLAPIVNALHRRKPSRLPRVLLVLAVETLFLLLVLGVLLLIVPILVREIPVLREQVPVLAERLNANLAPWLAQFGIHITLDVASIKAFIVKYLSANLEDAFGSALASIKLGGSVALALIGNAVLIPVVLFYLLLDWDRLVALALTWVPPRMRGAFDRFMQESDAVLGQYLRGQLLVMLLLALYYTILLALFGLDLALPIGIFTGLAIFVPYVGFGVGLVLATLAGLLQFASIKALLMVGVVYGIGQVIESLILTPRLVGERIGLHPLAVIFALLAFGQMLGFVGVLIALPASAVLLVAVRRLRASYMDSGLYTG